MRVPTCRRAFRRRVYRGLLCALVLLGQTVSAVGFSTMASIGKNKDKHCACPVPERVVGSCCCITPHEAPPEPIATAPAAINEGAEAGTPSCCLKSAKRSCCDQSSKHPPEMKPTRQGLRWLASLSAAHCQSDEPMGLIAAEPVIAERAIAIVQLNDGLCESLVLGAYLTISHPLDLPVPPPR